MTDLCESVVTVMQSLKFHQQSREGCAGIKCVAIEGTSVTATFTMSFKCDYAVQRTTALASLISCWIAACTSHLYLSLVSPNALTVPLLQSCQSWSIISCIVVFWC